MAISPDLVVELGAVYPDPAFVLDHDIPPTSRLRAPRHRRVLLRTPQQTFSTGCVFSETGPALNPAAHASLVVQVLLAEGAFQISLLAPDHFALDHQQHRR